jgi:hypothetical protein
MPESAPILFVIGIEGQIYMAEALGRELNRPVIAVITNQRIMEMMTPERIENFQNIYSLSDCYLEQIDGIRRLSRQELDKEQRALEKELGVGCSALYTNYDRTLRWLGGFRKVRNRQLCNIRFAKMIFDEAQPAFVHSGIAIYLQHVIHDICRRKDIPYVRASSNRSGGAVMYHADGHFVGMEKYFDALTRSGEKAIDPQNLREADEAFDSFVNRPRVPQYAVDGSTLGLNIPLLRKKIGWALRREHLFPSQKVKDVDRAMNIETPPHLIALSALRTGFRRLHVRLLNVFDKAPDLSVPFVYVPLHYAPEISDMYFGTDYDHHEAFIAHLSKHIPSDCQLYVKDHVSMWGRRPAGFYKNLSMLYNVKIIDPAVSTFDLIKAARATLTVTGTAGWEAYLLGRRSWCWAMSSTIFCPGSCIARSTGISSKTSRTIWRISKLRKKTAEMPGALIMPAASPIPMSTSVKRQQDRKRWKWPQDTRRICTFSSGNVPLNWEESSPPTSSAGRTCNQ